jgi:hypothetical protein
VFRQLQTDIAQELRAYCKTLVADAMSHLKTGRDEILGADAMNHLRAGMDECLKAENELLEDFSKQLQACEQKLQCLAAGVSNMEMRLSKTASQQQLSAHVQTFESHATAVFKSFEESVQQVQRNLRQAGIPQFDALPKQPCGNFMHSRTDSGGKLHPPSASSNEHFSATGKCASLAPEQFQVRQETSFMIEALETTLASMQEHEHEQIRRLRERIREGSNPPPLQRCAASARLLSPVLSS